jgi:2-C-methyl-D-erythritol 4-phosphate cytidylyltransferase
MGTGLRKQYRVVAGRPILAHTLLRFDQCRAVDQICLVVPGQDVDFCREHILQATPLNKPIQLVAGGPERQESVYNGLVSLDRKEGFVAIHDGVRPLIDPPLIDACIKGAAVSGACVPAVRASDTIKKVNRQGRITGTVERNGLWLVQTPQVFEYRIIADVHERARKEGFKSTDDAGLVERFGYPVHIINGSKSNIKVTTQEDLAMVAALLSSGP